MTKTYQTAEKPSSRERAVALHSPRGSTALRDMADRLRAKITELSQSDLHSQRSEGHALERLRICLLADATKTEVMEEVADCLKRIADR